jgi:hypothetical protein
LSIITSRQKDRIKISKLRVDEHRHLKHYEKRADRKSHYETDRVLKLLLQYERIALILSRADRRIHLSISQLGAVYLVFCFIKTYIIPRKNPMLEKITGKPQKSTKTITSPFFRKFSCSK